jgi:uncharacterized protein (DUF885 family)
MKRTAMIVAALALLACVTGPVWAQSAEDAKFKKFQDTFWDAYFKFYPTAGTLQGYAKYNDKLEDPSEGALDKFNEQLDAFNQELVTKIDRTKLSAENQIDHALFLDFIDLEFLKLQYTLPWQDNPLLYNDLFVNSLRSLLVRNGGANAAAAAARAKLIPNLVKRAKDSLKNPPQEYTQAALDQMPAVIDFYRIDVPKLSGGAAALQAEVVKAVAALEDYQRFLKGELLGRSNGNFRMPEPHMRALRGVTQGNLPILEDIVPRSQADVKNIRNAMGEVCIPYFKIMYPDVNPDQLAAQKGVDVAIASIIQGVFDKLKGDHVGRDEFIARISTAAADLEGFVQKHGLINLPAEKLAVEPMPAYFPPGRWTALMSPGAFEAAGAYALFVRPIPVEWSAEDATSFLEEHNNFYVDFMAVQKIFPGSFVPTAFTRQDPSIIRRLAPNQALLKGWPVFLEQMLVEKGYGEFDLRMRLNQLKLLLKNVIDFQMDLNIHEGTYTKDRVVDYMTRSGFMTKAEAERRWNQIVLNPGNAAHTYIGYQELLDMQKDYQKAKGASYSDKEFLQRLLSYGPIPLRTLKIKMAQ